MIAGLVRLAQGRLSLEGGDPELTIAEQAHYLGHQDALKPSLTVAENLRFWAGFLGAQAADIRPLRSTAVGLDGLADLPAAYLSAGQRRRLSIARLVAVKRPIWLLDEPTSALDAAGPGPPRRPDAGASRRRRPHLAATHGADRARTRAGAAAGGRGS